MSPPPPRRPVIQTREVRRFSLAIIEEPSHRIVTIVAPIPEAWVHKGAEKLRAMLPALHATAGAKVAVMSAALEIAEMLGSRTRPRRPTKKR